MSHQSIFNRRLFEPTGRKPEVSHSILAAFALLILSGPHTVFAAGKSAVFQRLVEGASAITHMQAWGDYIYWIDRNEHRVCRLRAPRMGASDKNSGAIAEAETIWSGLPLPSPIGLTVDAAGVVYVVDEKQHGVFSLASSTPKLLYSSAPLFEPSAVAAAGDRLFVIDRGTNKLYSLAPTGGELTWEYDFTDAVPDQLLSDENELIAYQVESRVLFHFSIKPNSSSKDSDRSSFTRLSSGKKLSLGKLLGDVRDFTVQGGIVYFIDQRNAKLTLLPLEGASPSSIPIELIAKTPVAVAASHDSLFFLEGDPERIRRKPILLPVTINFVGGEWTSRSVVEFYSYLSQNGLLPKQKVEVTSSTTLKELTRDLNLLPTGYVHEFQLLFCEMNEGTCLPEQKKLPTRNAPVSQEFSINLTAGQSIAVPDLPIITYITRRNVKLPLDPVIYNPDLFGHLAKSNLEQVAKELGPKTLTQEDLRTSLRRLNADYLGSDLFNETTGAFSIPIQGARITAVVPQTDLLNANSFIRKLTEKSTFTGTSPTFQLRQESVGSQRFWTHPIFRGSVGFLDDCLPSDPAIRSSAMDIINYCEPILSNSPKVGIIDYEFNGKHPAFAMPDGGSALEVFGSNDLVVTDALNVDPTITEAMKIDHGTHIAGIIGARLQPNEMVGLLPTSKLYGVRLESLNEALEARPNFRVFNVSLGEQGATGGPLSGVDELETMILQQRDKLFVLSAGNNQKPVNRHALAAQGNMDNVLVVGATDVPELDSAHQRPRRSVLTLPNGEGSNFHPEFVSLMAPGQRIKSALVNGRYGFADGTSEATAFVTGAAAALATLEDDWAPWQIKFRLVATADLWTGTSQSNTVLAGELNFKRALSDRDAVVIERDVPAGACRGDLDPVSLTQTFSVKRLNKPPIPISWNQVLRIKRDQRTGTEYTILYFAINHFNDRDNRQLLRQTRVTASQLLGVATFNFNPRDTNCAGGPVSLIELVDFINKGPYPTIPN